MNLKINEPPLETRAGNYKGGLYKHLRDIYYLTKSQFLTMRTGWVWYIIMTTFLPTITLLFLFLILNYQIQNAIYIVTGNIVFTVTVGSLNTLANQMGWMKQNKYFEHYAGLPISKVSLIIAFVTRCTLFSIPSMIFILLLGKFLFKLPILLHPLLLFVFILSGFSLSGIGGVIGIYSKDSNNANIITNIVFPILVFAAPVMVPVSFLPLPLRYLSYILPTTYIANAYRSILSGVFDWNLGLNMLAIAFFTVVSLFLVTKKFDWRVD